MSLMGRILIGAAMLTLVAGCSGADGANGNNGADGAPGTDGVNGQDGQDGTNGTNGSNGTDGTDGTDGTSGTDATQKNLKNLDFEITQVSNDGGAIAVTFTVADNGNAITNLTMAPIRIYINQYYPAANAYDNAIWSVDNFYERGSTQDADLRLVQDPPGTYTYTFLETIQEGIDNDGVDVTLTQQVAMRIRGFENYNSINDIYQIDSLPANDGDVATEVAAPVGNIVETSACETCHGPRIGNVGHGGGYNKVEMCRNCHTRDDPGKVTNGTDLATMIHQIHAAIDHTNGGTDPGEDWSHIGYPQAPNNCAKCHQGIDGDNWNTLPTAEACGSCHYSVDFAVGTNHVGGAQADNANCGNCHADTAIRGYHASETATPNNPDVPAGAVNFTYVINSVTMSGNDATINFQILADGVAITDLHTTYPPTGFTGSPSFLFAYALPQGGIAEPADFNNLGNSAGQPSSASLSTLTFTPAAGDTYDTTVVGAFPAGATMRTVGLQGYFTQTSPALARHTVSAVMPVDGDDERRSVVKFEGCMDCHEIFEGHGGNRVIGFDTPAGSQNVCSLCHVPNLSSGGNTMDTTHANWTGNATTLATRAMYGDDPFAWPEDGQSLKDLVHGIHGSGVRENPYQHVRVRSNNAYGFDWSHVGFPGDASNCSKCHEDTSYLPDEIPDGALMSTVKTGEPTNRAEALAVRASVPNANDRTNPPVSAACNGCHNGDIVNAHMDANGAMLWAYRSDQEASGLEQCNLCHASGKLADVAVVHSGLNP